MKKIMVSSWPKRIREIQDEVERSELRLMQALWSLEGVISEVNQRVQDLQIRCLKLEKRVFEDSKAQLDQDTY